MKIKLPENVVKVIANDFIKKEPVEAGILSFFKKLKEKHKAFQSIEKECRRIYSMYSSSMDADTMGQIANEVFLETKKGSYEKTTFTRRVSKELEKLKEKYSSLDSDSINELVTEAFFSEENK